MYTIIGSDGQHYGPVDAPTITQWLSDRRASPQTLARNDAGSDWQPLCQFAEFAHLTQPPPLAVKIEPIKIDAVAYANDLIARAPQLDIGSCFSRAWILYKSDFWPILGTTMACFLLMGAVPFGAVIAYGVLMGGLLYYYLGKVRKQPRTTGDIFIGMSRLTMPLFLVGLITIGLTTLAFMPAYVLIIVSAITHSLEMLIIAGVVWMLGWLVTFYITAIWTFAIPLVIDKHLSHRDALAVSYRVASAQLARMVGLSMVASLLMLCGVVVFIVGAYLVMPLILLAYAYAYEDLCNPPDKKPTV